MEKPKILILVFSNLKHDARVMRQINFLKKRYQLVVVCLDINPTDEFEVIILPDHKLTFMRKAIAGLFLFMRAYNRAHHALYPYNTFLKEQLRGKTFDLVIANDVETLPLAFDVAAGKAKVLFDAHEYAPLHFENKFWWRVFFQGFNTFLCKHYIPQLAAMTTIGQGLADEYGKNFGLKPVVITNATNYNDLLMRESNEPTLRLIHHGIVNRSRKIEMIVEMMNYLPEYYTLDLVLVVPSFAYQSRAYYEELKANSVHPRVTFREAVPITQVVGLLHQYDMGIILAPPINFNYANGLPNKLFDYIQARIAVLTGPTPEIARIVNQFNLGVVADGFTPELMARKLMNLTREKMQDFKRNSDAAAKAFNAEKNEIILNDLVSEVLKR